MTQPLTHRRKLRVLIADDIQETRRNTRLMLATIDDVEVVAIAANGIQAVQLAKEHHPDIVLLDINMPEMDGLEFVKAVRQDARYSGLVVMMVTTETEPDQMLRALTAGADEYLMKPFAKDGLVDKLRLVGMVK